MDHFQSNNNHIPVNDQVFPGEWESSESDHVVFGSAGNSFNMTILSPEHLPTNTKMIYHRDEYFGDDQDMQISKIAHHYQCLYNNLIQALCFDNDDDCETSEDLLMEPILNIDTSDLDDDAASIETIEFPLEEKYKANLQTLEASMKRSQETRNCLIMKTSATESYERIASIKEILSSIATSSVQVQNYVTEMKRPM